MRGRRHKLAVSTFPFLAVLLCAMGSLILILLVMDRKAHKAAQARAQREVVRLAEEAAQSAAARQAEMEQKKQQARAAWEQKRDALHAKLTNEQIELQLQMRKVRDQLSAIAARLRYEQDTSTELRRKVRDERGKLQADQQLLLTLRSSAGQAAAQSKESSETLRRMTVDLLRMEQALKDLKAARQREQHTFSVVPYHGRRGENRRPIYVECTAAGVIFHPERRAMPVTSREFLLGRENADAPPDDVRAEVERRVARQRAKMENTAGAADKTPYLLLLVRPDGIETYHVFQDALKGLSLDFGYEFIDADWVLDFPADDEQPSKQPWMATTKTPADSAAPAKTSTTPRQIGMAPSGVPNLQGIRTNERGGAGPWSLRGSANSTGSGGGTTPGTRRSSAVVFGGAGVSSSGGGTTSGSGNSTSRADGSANSLGGAPGLFGQSGSSGAPSSSSAGGDGSANGGSAWAPNRGGGRGHPSALAPSWGDGGGIGAPSEGGTPGSGYGAPGAYVLGGTGRPYAPGAALSGAPASSGSETTSLGTPQALPSGSSAIASSGAGGSGSPGRGYSGGNSTTTPAGQGSSTLSGGRQPPDTGGAQGADAPRSGNMSGTPGAGSVQGVGDGTRGNGAPGNGVPGNGTTGTGIRGTGTPGSGTPGGGGSSGSNPGSPGISPDGRYTTARGSGGPGGGAGQPGIPGGSSSGAMGGASSGQPGTAGTPNSAGTSSAVAGQGSSGTAGATGQRAPGVASANGYPGQPSSGQPGTADGAPGDGSGPSRGGNGSAAYAAADPLMPKQPRGLRPADRGEEPPPEDAPPSVPRGKMPLQHGGLGGGGDSSGPPSSFATPSYQKAKPRKPANLRPAWVHGGRDWTIYVECLPDGVKLYPSEKTFPLAAIREGANNPLVTAIRQMIDRRQSGRRAGEPPYYPQVRLLVRPENVRTFLKVYPALEALPVPKTRQNLDPDDDVRDIVTGANP
ncbi:MAG TPA: hypothetical protein VH575_30035 [Gemmataceae bacterium]